MRRTLCLALSLPLAAAVAAAAEPALKTEESKVLYSLGAALARDLSVFSLTPAEAQFVIMGLRDAVGGKTPQVDLRQYGPKINDLAAARAKSKSEAEKKRAKAYLDKAAKEPGAAKTPSGLIYFEVKPGTGAAPKPEDRVQVHYNGTFTDGKVFDSSIARGTPAEFPLGQVIACWTEGLQKMKVGGKAKLVCPSDIAYGDQGHPPVIPGGATLVFEVELLGIVKK